MKTKKFVSFIDRMLLRNTSNKIITLLFIFLVGGLFNSNYSFKAGEITSVNAGGEQYFVLGGSNMTQEDLELEVSREYEQEIYRNPRVVLTPSDGTLYSKVPASQSIVGQDVCIYVSNMGSQDYVDAINGERAVWGVPAVGHTQDLDEGGMLRAGEAMELYTRGSHSQRLDHSSVEYNVGAWENLTSRLTFNSLDGFDFYMTEKAYLPSDFTPFKYTYLADYNGQTIGHYVTMVSPSVKYAGQGMSFSDDNCDGSVESIIYAEEHYTDGSDRFPDFKQEISKNLGGTNTSTNVETIQETVPASNVATASNVTSQVVVEDTPVVNSEESKISEEDSNKSDENSENTASVKEDKQEEKVSNEKRREQEREDNSKTYKYRNNESLTTAGRSHFMTMMMWTLVISVVYFIGSKLLYLRNK